MSSIGAPGGSPDADRAHLPRCLEQRARAHVPHRQGAGSPPRHPARRLPLRRGDLRALQSRVLVRDGSGSRDAGVRGSGGGDGATDRGGRDLCVQALAVELVGRTEGPPSLAGAASSRHRGLGSGLVPRRAPRQTACAISHMWNGPMAWRGRGSPSAWSRWPITFSLSVDSCSAASGEPCLVHGADTELFDPARWPKEEARQRVGLPSGRYILFAGAPAPHKGLDELLLAVERIGLGDVRLLIVGSTDKDPSYPRRLAERHGDRLVWMGPRPHEEMPMFLAAADVVALPQRLNRVSMAQVPGKVFEAMAMARPILATAVSDLPEILDGAARVVEPGSIEALTEGLADLLRQPSAAEDLGHAARARCIERYSWDAMERTIGECFARLRFD